MSAPDIHENQPAKLVGSSDGEALAALSYPTEIVGYGLKGREVKKITETPFVAFPAFGGFLVGGNRGEWGGELVFKPSTGGSVRLVDDNVVDVYQMPFGIVALTGLAHLSMDKGSIYLIAKDASGKVAAKKLHGLPGWPARTALLESGDLLIGIIDGHLPPNSEGVMSPTWRWLSLGSAGELRPVTCATDSPEP